MPHAITPTYSLVVHHTRSAFHGVSELLYYLVAASVSNTWLEIAVPGQVDNSGLGTSSQLDREVATIACSRKAHRQMLSFHLVCESCIPRQVIETPCKDSDTFLRIRPTGFFVSGAGSHIHVEEGSNPAKVINGILLVCRQSTYRIPPFVSHLGSRC